jgi:argonaute-like protein implicated in RNA metabolism and viral defense
MVYENNDRVFQAADSVYNNLVKASQQLGIKIEEPYWIEMKKENDRRELDAEIRQYIQGGG